MRKKLLSCIILSVFALASCKKDDEFIDKNQAQDNTLETKSSSGLMVLGKQLENPYSVENMNIAWANIRRKYPASTIAESNINIRATHLYIKFKPKDEEDFEMLKDDTTLVLYSYPLDYEILREGDYYHDPSIREDMPTYQYLAVRTNKTLPEKVEHEILEELYIPEEDTTLSNGKITEELVDALVDESLRLTDNLDDSGNTGGRLAQPNGLNKVQGSKWRPAGRIRILDDVTGNWRGVEGAIVRARRWFTTHEGMVDANGFYSCDGTFRRAANYSIDWERHHFALREGWLWSAVADGPKKEGNWDLELLDRGDKRFFHATIFMAAYHYYYRDIRGLRRPPLNSFWTTQLRIKCYNESNSDANGNHNAVRRFLGLGSAVHIYNQRIKHSNLRIFDTYSTTIHELAHASHWNMDKDSYNCMNDDNCAIQCCSGDEIVAESWARGVQWELTRTVWPTYPGGPRIAPDYAQVVVDMIDGINDINNGEENLSNDNVTGYTIREIEDALIGQKTWNGWRDNIKTKYSNGTENNIDALFQYWGTFTE